MSHEAFVSAVENAASSELAVLRAPYDGVVQQAYLLLNFAGRQEGLARLLLCPGEDAAVRARIAVLAVKDGPDSDVEGTRRLIMNGVDTREHGTYLWKGDGVEAAVLAVVEKANRQRRFHISAENVKVVSATAFASLIQKIREVANAPRTARRSGGAGLASGRSGVPPSDP